MFAQSAYDGHRIARNRQWAASRSNEAALRSLKMKKASKQ